jgi:CDP-glucose 4,6-dehydratase
MKFEKILSDTFCDRTVLVTGHTGFKGGWLSLWLDSLGAKVIGYSREPPTTPSFFQETRVAQRIVDIRGDITDIAGISDAVTRYNPDFVFHLAAQPLVRDSYKNPLDTFRINVIGTANILEAMRLAESKAIVVCITSDKCYENREWTYAYRENDAMGGYDPYSASKGAAEIVIAAYRNSYFSTSNTAGCSVSSARAGNIMGGGDWAKDRIVPDCVQALVKGEAISIRNPLAVRPWQHVLDPLSGYLQLAHNMKQDPKMFSGAWNFGPMHTSTIDVRHLTEKIIHEWGSGKWTDISDPCNQLHEAQYLKLDIAKSVTMLGWRPVYPVDKAIEKTVAWYREYYKGQTDMCRYSLQQIGTYMEDASNTLR